VTSTLPGGRTAASCDKFTGPQGCKVTPRLVAKSRIDKARVGLNPDIRVRGILPTFVQRTNIARKVLEEIKAEYPRLLYPFGIDHSVRHVEASLLGVPVVIADPAHQGAIAYNQLAEDLLS
jgi:chromosome partitioning protein